MWQQKEENGFEDILDYERFDTHIVFLLTQCRGLQTAHCMILYDV